MAGYPSTPWEWRPFRYEDGSGRVDEFKGLYDADGEYVLFGVEDNAGNGWVVCDPDRADFLLRACNSHEELLEAAKEIELAVRLAIPQEAVAVINERGDFDALVSARIHIEEVIAKAGGNA
jgi:hypothetical protein